MRLKFYYKKHLRSLFLSKFIYYSVFQIIQLDHGILQLGFKKEKLNYGLAYIFLFLISHLSPIHNIKFNVVRGKKRLSFGTLSLKLQNNFFYIFLEKMNVIYLPNLENWVGILKSLTLQQHFFFYRLIKIEDFSIFPELDFLVNFNFSSLQAISQKWFFNFYFAAFAVDDYEFTTLLRSFEFPLSFKN